MRIVAPKLNIQSAVFERAGSGAARCTISSAAPPASADRSHRATSRERSAQGRAAAAGWPLPGPFPSADEDVRATRRYVQARLCGKAAGLAKANSTALRPRHPSHHSHPRQLARMPACSKVSPATSEQHRHSFRGSAAEHPSPVHEPGKSIGPDTVKQTIEGDRSAHAGQLQIKA